MTPQKKRHNDTQTSLDSKVQLIVLVGTAFHILANWLSRFPNALILIADVAAELEQLSRSIRHSERTILLPIGGQGTTRQTIDDHGTEEQASVLKLLPNVATSSGQCQLGGVGEAGIKQEIAKPATQRLFAQIVPKLTELSGGQFQNINSTFYTSLAGGTGCLGSGELADELTKYFRTETDLTLNMKIRVLGGTTFWGQPFVHTQLNSGSALTYWINRCLHPVDDRTTISFYGQELYPVGDDRQLRDLLLLDQEAAFRAPEFALRLTQDESNRAVNGPLANICLFSSDHFANISLRQVLRDMAEAYLSDIEDLLQTPPARNRLLDIEFYYQMSQSRLASSYDLALKAIDVPIDSVMELLDCECHVEKFEPRAVLLSGAKTPLESIAEQSTRLPSSPDEYAKAIGLLMAIEDSSFDKIDALEDELADLEVSLKDATELVLKRWKKLDGPPLVSLKSDDDRFADFEESIEEYQVCLRATYEAEGEIGALQSAASQIGDVSSMLTDRLQTLSESLRSRADVHSGISQQPLVAAKPLDETFESLLKASGSSGIATGLLDECLGNSVAAVTRAGLKSITGAVDTSIDAIIDAVRCQNNVIKGPGWAGEDGPIDLEYVVYPPVQAADRQLLKDAHAGQFSARKVAFSEQDAASLNVVIVRATYCRSTDDVLRPFYRNGLRKALASPLSSLIIPDRDLPGSIGIKFE